MLRIAMLIVALGCMPAGATERLTMLLNWVPQGDHSPFYYGIKLGLYEKAGIELTMEGGRGSGATIQRVAAGQVPLGVADMSNILHARGKGADTVAIMPIYSRTAIGLYWKKSSGIKGPKDFAGRKVGSPPGDAIRPLWPVIAKEIGIASESVSWVNIAPEAKVASLKSDVIDISPHFYSVHDVYEATFGDNLGYMSLFDLGLNPYGLSVLANPDWLKANGATMKTFVTVSQQAFRACRENPEPCTAALAEATSQKASEVLANWRRVETLLGAMGPFDPQRIEADARLVETTSDVKIGDATSAYSNAAFE